MASGTRAALYTRVSLDRRDERRSVSEQETDLRATCAVERWDILEVFTDNDRSASRYARKARPAFIRLREATDAGRFDIIAVWELSRLSRDLGTLVAFRDLCRDRGVRWSVGGRTYDPGDDRDTLPLIVQACQAESESASTSKRVRRAMTATATAGRPHGRATYGYRREYDAATGVLTAQVVDEAQAAILREVSGRFLSGEAFYAIARDLTSRGVPTPGAATRTGGTRWHPTNLSRLMRNPAYIGRRMQNGQYVADAIWPAIFSDSEWLAMQTKLVDPTRLTHKESAVRYLLVGIAICGKCESNRMGTVKQRGGYLAYICLNCFGVGRRMDVTDAHVEAQILERLSAPDMGELFGPGEQDDETQRTLTELRARLSALEDEAVAGTVSAAAFGRFEAKLIPQIEAAELAAHRAALPPAVHHLAGVDPDHVVAVWGVLTVQERRDALRAMGAEVRILPTGSGRRVFDPASVPVTFR